MDRYATIDERLMIAPTVDPRMAGIGWLLANAATITGRNLRRLVRDPTLIAFATVQPVMLVLLFNYAFGGAVSPPGVERYIDYALPGIYVVALAFGATRITQYAVARAQNCLLATISRGGPTRPPALVRLALRGSFLRRQALRMAAYGLRSERLHETAATRSTRTPELRPRP